ncbi:MAG: hypothetical protein JXB32_12480 [Deltaproteobacteria bacterium]|nr:hypothetical protein [Deltaproteobacteria bacterium]
MPGSASLPCTVAVCLSLLAAAPSEAAPEEGSADDEPEGADARPNGITLAPSPQVDVLAGPGTGDATAPAGPETTDGAGDVADVPGGDGTPEAPAPVHDAQPEPPTAAARNVSLPPVGADGTSFEPPPLPPQAHMSWDLPVTCLMDGTGVVRLRYQCPRAPVDGEEGIVCRYSSGRELREDGGDGPELERTRPCDYYDSIPHGRLAEYLRERLPDGARLDPAIAEAPPGWRRDERGRVFQVSFDLYRRVFLGTRWYPALLSPGGLQLGRVGLEIGSRIEILSDDLRTRYRLQVLPGEVLLNPLGVTGTLLRFDASRDAENPLLRITTFWGTPARHDLYADVAGWFDVLGVEYRPRNSVDELQLRFLAGGFTWDLWHSTDMYGYVRLRGGAAFDDLYLDRDGVDNRVALTPVVAVEGDVTFDDDGFHHLTFVSTWEAPFVWREDAGTPAFTQRFLNEAAYEVIFLAINDQPLTFRVAVGGGYRDDVESPARGWELTAGAGLRFSFWVPAREEVSEALAELAHGWDD